MGQLYNKDFKKGTLLLALGVVLFGGFVVWFWMVVKPYFQGADPAEISEAFVQQIIQEVLQTHKSSLLALKVALGLLWAYGIVDAFVVAKSRQAAPKD